MTEVAEITRDKVLRIEAEMFRMPQVELKHVDYFSKGVYARELHIPAGVTLTGKIHKYQNLNILSKGEMTVSTDEGMKRVSAPFTIVSPPGTKRVAYAHTDCIWTTIHGTDKQDVDQIELEFIAQSDTEYLEFCKQLQIAEK
jgi:quercetin dioxygenase-like cupin family protein